jgi:hypothetical protein
MYFGMSVLGYCLMCLMLRSKTHTAAALSGLVSSEKMKRMLIWLFEQRFSAIYASNRPLAQGNNAHAAIKCIVCISADGLLPLRLSQHFSLNRIPNLR